MKTYTSPPPMVIDSDRSYQAKIKTELGTMVAELFAEQVPNTVNNFVFLARDGYYDGVIFHRVIGDFMAQTGDPTGTGRGGPGYQFEDEFSPALRHDRPGTLSMANAGPDTNGSQFFLTHTATPWLDDKHAVFGRVIEGLDVLLSIPARDPANPAEPGVKVDTIEIDEA